RDGRGARGRDRGPDPARRDRTDPRDVGRDPEEGVRLEDRLLGREGLRLALRPDARGDEPDLSDARGRTAGPGLTRLALCAKISPLLERHWLRGDRWTASTSPGIRPFSD